MLSRCTQILCSAVRGIGLPQKVYFVHHGDLTVGIANPSWQTRFSACCRIGTISVLWSHDAHGVPTIIESLQAGTTVFRGSKRFDVRLATMDVPPVLNLISLRSIITDLEICGFASRGERALERPAEKSGRNRTKSACWSEEALEALHQARRVGCWIVIREGGMGVLVIGPPLQEMPIASQRCLWPLS